MNEESEKVTEHKALPKGGVKTTLMIPASVMAGLRDSSEAHGASIAQLLRRIVAEHIRKDPVLSAIQRMVLDGTVQDAAVYSDGVTQHQVTFSVSDMRTLDIFRAMSGNSVSAIVRDGIVTHPDVVTGLKESIETHRGVAQEKRQKKSEVKSDSAESV